MKTLDRLKTPYIVVALAFIPCAALIPFFWMERMYQWELAASRYYEDILLGCLLPLYAAYLEFGALVGRHTDGKVRSRAELRFGYGTAAVAAALVLSTVGVYIPSMNMAHAMSALILYTVTLFGLPVLWIIGALLYRKKLRFTELASPAPVRMPAVLLPLILLSCALGGLFFAVI